MQGCHVMGRRRDGKAKDACACESPSTEETMDPVALCQVTRSGTRLGLPVLLRRRARLWERVRSRLHHALSATSPALAQSQGLRQ